MNGLSYNFGAADTLGMSSSTSMTPSGVVEYNPSASPIPMNPGVVTVEKSPNSSSMNNNPASGLYVTPTPDLSSYTLPPPIAPASYDVNQFQPSVGVYPSQPLPVSPTQPLSVSPSGVVNAVPMQPSDSTGMDVSQPIPVLSQPADPGMVTVTVGPTSAVPVQTDANGMTLPMQTDPNQQYMANPASQQDTNMQQYTPNAPPPEMNMQQYTPNAQGIDSSNLKQITLKAGY